MRMELDYILVGWLLTTVGVANGQSWLSWHGNKDTPVYRMPKELPGHVFNPTVIANGSHVHLFWASKSNDEDERLWYLCVNTSHGPVGAPVELGRMRRAPGESYRAVLRDGTLCVVWNSGDGILYRCWGRARLQWGPPEVLTAARTAETPAVFPGRDIAFWVDAAPADLTPLYAAATQPSNRSESERAAEFMSRVHSSRYYVSSAKPVPGDKRTWSVTHDVLGPGGEDINGFYVVVFEDKEGGFSIFATSPPQSSPGERLRRFVYRPEAGTSTLRSTWRSAADAACFNMFRLPGGSRYCVFWLDTSDVAVGVDRLFSSFSDVPEHVSCLSRNSFEHAGSPPVAAFHSVSGDERGLAVWLVLQRYSRGQ